MAQVEIAFDAPAVDWWVLTPQIILVGAALGLLLAASLAPRALPGWVSTIVTIATGAATAITAAVQWNDWGSAPRSTLKDAFVSDGFSLLLTVLVGAGVVMTALVAHSALDRYEMAPPEFAALLLASAAGAVVMAGANDLIVLFLGLESLSIALYVLIALAGRRASARESAMKYFVLGAFSSAFFLYGIALVYGSTGSTNLSGIGGFLFGSIRETDYLLLAGIALLLVGLGFKVAAVPFHFWAPDVYEGAPSPVTGYLASIAKAAGFAALARVLYVAVAEQSIAWAPILIGLAFATLAVGAVMAICQNDVKRMLAYSSISHAGFVLVGLSAVPATSGLVQWTEGGGDAVSSSVFYLIVYSFMALGSFAVLSVVGAELQSSEPDASAHALSRYGGLARRRPVLALAFTVLLLAQAGVPFTAGFWAKLGVILAAVDARGYVLPAVAMVTAVVSAFAYLRVVLAMYAPEGSSEDEGGTPTARASRQRWGNLPLTSVFAISLAVAVTVVVGVLPQTLLEWSRDAILSIIL
ncbi:NADH-quinone oxidoreductase subunit N [Candidatus Poriferisodalis multihospitum]|uniref:NADH-quinone oxidoreductase subunit N n=1 Tax=Candidatus Poriferisodalis multihospitum TaxID=2983191 RepID=UPI0023A37A97|nr:NADH-quinone oxidoreductase subunit N [Candidatus Poriferisodalis multihospitum]MDE0677576.1 NADH-quinone oxidoreductase subunit N [Acidimicrobiaceae bacterium]